MKRIAFLLVMLLVAIGKLSQAQSITATGNVKDEKGNPLHYVFVADNQLKTAVFTDSLGNFTIPADLGSKLQFEYAGYTDTQIDITNNTNIQVVLRVVGSGTSSAGALTALKTISTQPLSAATQSSDMATLASGGAISGTGLAHQKGNVHGSRYLFDGFVHGFLVNSANELIYNPAYLFDYDKMGGGLLITQDKQSVIEAIRDQTNSFTIYSNTDERFVFEKAPTIDATHYVQVLASGKKYKIYKTISTRFVKSDYVNSGLTTHGNDYDEFIDEFVYYVLDVASNQLQKISLKKKAIKTAFAKEPDKVNKYFADNSGDIDDNYLGGLGDYMNK